MQLLTRLLAGTLQALAYAGACMLMGFALVVLGMVLWNALQTIRAAMEFGG